MTEKYADSFSDFQEILVEQLGFTQEEAEESLDDLENYQEEPYKRSTNCYGWLKHPRTDNYYPVNFTSDYDWGNSNFNIDLRPRKMIVEQVVTQVKKFISAEEN